MIIFLEEFRQVLKSMLINEVEFIIIGGYAVNYHGYNRPTGDMDIWLRPDNKNKDKFINMLEKENFSKKSINNIIPLDFTRSIVFHFGNPPKRIDFLTKISGVDFEEAWNKKELLPMESYMVPVLHLNHLILSKISNNRSRDKTDIEELQKVAMFKK